MSFRPFLRPLHRCIDDPPAGREWKLATYLKRGVTHLWIDGYLSNSSETGVPHHLIYDFLASLAEIEPDWEFRARAFSYFKPTATYNGWFTTASVEAHVQKLASVLGNQENQRAKWVITAYSLGAVVTLITLRRMAQQDPGLRTRVPLVVLVAPALYGAKDLFDYYGQTDDTPFGVTLPSIMHELRSENERHPQEALQAIDVLLDCGIAVAVLYYNPDGVAPYAPLVDRRILHRVYEPQQRQRASAPIRAHFEARTNPDIHEHVYYLVKPSVSLTKRR